MLVSKLISIFALIWIADARCSLIGDLCYSFPEIKLNYVDAQEYCRSLNQNLGVVHTEEQHGYLTVAASIRWAESTRFWIGLSRPSHNSSFVWSDGSSLDLPINDNGDNLYVAGSTETEKWKVLDGKEELNFVCSYLDTVSIKNGKEEKPKPTVTCLFMVDLQSSGIDQQAIATYKSYFKFAQLVAAKLNDASQFTGFLDTFGYSAGLGDHEHVSVYTYDNFRNLPFSILNSDDEIDLDLKDVDSTLKTAHWVPSVEDQTCMLFFSAAPESLYGGSTIQTAYASFSTLVGVLVGEATSIPGLTNTISTPKLSDADASAVVELLLESLPSS